MWVNKLFWILLFGCFFVVYCFGQEGKAFAEGGNAISQDSSASLLLELFVPVQPSDSLVVNVEEEVSAPSFFHIDSFALNQILDNPLKDWRLKFYLEGEEYIVHLQRTQIYSGSTEIRSVSSLSINRLFEPKHFWGNREGAHEVPFAISFFDTEISGLFEFENEHWEIGQIKGQPEFYSFYRSSNIQKEPFYNCFTDSNYFVSPGVSVETLNKDDIDNCIQLYIEVDHDIFLDKGENLVTTANFVEAALSQVFLLYANSDINISLSEMLIWDVPDPYDGISSFLILEQFKNQLDGNFNGDLAHLIGYKGGGGIAYVDVLCDPDHAVGYSGINDTFQYIPNYSWTVNVMTHEIGHNIGSPHTHACAWNGNNTAIDGCGPSAGYDEGCSGDIPVSGTIMSYCHLISGVGIDLSNGFHPQVETLLQDKTYNADCLDDCSTIPIANFEVVQSSVCAGTIVQFYDMSEGPAQNRNWSFPGGFPTTSTQANPQVVYPTEGIYSVGLEVSNNEGTSDLLWRNNLMYVQSNGQQLIHYEDFEDGLSSWSISNPNQDIGFEIIETYGNQFGNKSLFIDNYNNTIGHTDYIQSAPLDFTDLQSVEFHMDYAYTTHGFVSDSIYLEYSLDGGNTFQNITSFYENGNGSFRTHIFTNREFYPSVADDWCYSETTSCIQISIPEIENQNDVVIRLRNKSLGGNNFFIDRIWLTAGCAQMPPPLADFNSDIQDGCADFTVQYQDLSSENPTSWHWVFEGGTPSESFVSNPVVQYTERGIYDVSLEVTNSSGTDILQRLNYIEVNDLPVALFEYEVDSNKVHFTNTSQFGQAFAWYFGDGESSIEEHPEHSYQTNGRFEVILEVSNECGMHQFRDTVDIELQPRALFVSSASSICEGDFVHFDASSAKYGSEYIWHLEGAVPSDTSATSFRARYAQQGSFDVRLIVNNEFGSDTLLQKDWIQVSSSAIASFNYSRNQWAVEFDNQSYSYDSVQWHFGDGSKSSELNPTHEYSEDGAYEVVLVAFNEFCGNDTSTLIIDVWKEIELNVEANLTLICAGQQIEFSAEINHADSFEWVFDGGIQQNTSLDSPVVVYADPGVYDVMLVAWNPNQRDSLLLKNWILVWDLPAGEFQYDLQGRNVEFSYDTSRVDAILWDFGDGQTSTEINPTHSYILDGEYIVTLQTFSLCGIQTLVDTIPVFTLPVADFSVYDNIGCAPLLVEFENWSSINATSFEWNFEGGMPTSSRLYAPVVQYSEPGAYSVRLIAKSLAGNDTLFLDSLIHVFAQPTAQFTFTSEGRIIYFDNLSKHGDSYMWDFGDGHTSSEKNPIHEYSLSGAYEVTLRVMSPCDTQLVTRWVQTDEKPSAFLSHTADTLNCLPYSVTYKDLSSGQIEGRNWYFEGGEPEYSSDSVVDVRYLNAGRFSVILQVYNASDTDSYHLQEQIQIRPQVEAEIQTLKDELTVEFTAETLGDSIVENYWEFGDGISGSGSPVVHTYQKSGTYQVLLVQSNLCSVDSITEEISVLSVGVDHSATESIVLFPNPYYSCISFVSEQLVEEIIILDVQGRVVTQTDTKGRRNGQIGCDLIPGMYYFHFLCQEGIYSYKVVKVE
jgi:PKD repeat protein